MNGVMSAAGLFRSCAPAISDVAIVDGNYVVNLLEYVYKFSNICL
jgi:hypothetical protein